MINRFEWLKAVLQSDLLDRAKVMASALAVQFGNDKTGQINPSLSTLCDYLRMSEDTARRALADLSKAGWLARTIGRGRGNSTAYALLSPGNVVPLRSPVSGRQGQDKRSHQCKVNSAGKGSTDAPKRSHRCNSHIKEEQSFEQKERARPSPHLQAFVKSGSWQATEWGIWLGERRELPLAALHRLHVEGGYNLPWSTPPNPSDEVATGVVLAVIEWAKEEARVNAA